MQNERFGHVPTNLEEACHVFFLFSPMLHTNLLYWACLLKLDIKIINDLITKTTCYPEA